MIHRHILLNAWGTGLLALCVVLYWGFSDRLRKRLHGLILLGLVAGFGLLVSGAWNGGEGVFRYSTGVGLPQSDFERSLTGLAQSGHAVQADTQALFPPLQLHLLLVGLALAAALAALGMALRALWQVDGAEAALMQVEQMPHLTVEHMPPGQVGEIAEGQESLPSTPHAPVILEESEPVYPARWWLVGMLLALAAAAAGLWQANLTSWPLIKETLGDSWQNAFQHRSITHAILGGSIIVLLALLAILARVAKRNKILLCIVALLLILAIAAQIRIGVEMLYDGSGGALWKFGGQ